MREGPGVVLGAVGDGVDVQPHFMFIAEAGTSVYLPLPLKSPGA